MEATEGFVKEVGFASSLIGVRVLLAGRGMAPTSSTSFANRPAPETWVLPGGYVAEIGIGANARGGRLLHPGGARPLSGVVDLTKPVCFASFMHNVDCCIYDGLCGAPEDAFVLADAIVRRRTPSLFEALGNNLDSGQWWEPNDEGRALLGRARERTAPSPRGADFALASLVRWNEQMDRWIHEARGVPHEAVGDGEYRWRRVDTACGMVAAARRAGLTEGLAGRGGRALSSPELRASIRKILEGHLEEVVLPTERELYVLQSGADSATALVSVERDEVVVLASTVAEAPLAAALAALEPAVGPKPSRMAP